MTLIITEKGILTPPDRECIIYANYSLAEMCLRRHEPSGAWLINERLSPFSLSSVTVGCSGEL